MSDDLPLSVALDATALLDRPTGIGVYVGELAGGLARRADVDVTAFAVSARGRNRLGDVVPPDVRVRSRPVPARLARAVWLRSDRLTARWMAGPADVVHGPNYVVAPGGGAAEVVTVSDLSAVHFPEMCSPDVLQWPPLLLRALERGAWVHTISEWVAEEVREMHPRHAERILAVPLGMRRPGPPTAGSDAARGRRLAGGERYVLALGTVEPRKDLPGLVAAFDRLADHDGDLRLVLAGPDGMGADALTAARRAARHDRRIVRLGWVDDPDRLALLRGASVVAYASRYEGFGLVPLEALAAGTPVVATSVGAIPEVLGDAGLLVEPGDVESLSDGLGRLLTDPTLAADLVARGQDRIDSHPWERTVDGLVDLYRRAAGDRRVRRPGRGRGPA